MPRIARVVAVGFPHHITQRGNYRQTVFEDEEDYVLYLQLLEKYCKKYSLKIWAYCLMSNHVHIIGVPMDENSLAKTFNAVTMKYAQYFNQKRMVKGHLWQGRFYSCILDERHLYAAVRYIENNPVRAGIVKKPWEYKWSSARAHVGEDKNPNLLDDCYLLKEIDDCLVYLMEGNNETLINNIRENTRKGRPCGEEPFIKTIEELLGKRLMVLPKGRPFKKK